MLRKNPPHNSNTIEPFVYLVNEGVPQYLRPLCGSNVKAISPIEYRPT
jgi:hypothetical protein